MATHNPATTGNPSARRYVARTRRNRQSKPASGALREARSRALRPLPAPMPHRSATAAPRTLGLSAPPFHDPFHEPVR